MSVGKKFKFYFDVVCPYAYLAAERISRLPEEVRSQIDWIPVHLGGLLKSIESPTNPMNAMSQARLRANLVDLHRWAQRLTLPLSMVAEHPMRTVGAMRHLSLLEGDERRRVARAYFRAYWSSGSTAHWLKVEAQASAYIEEIGAKNRSADLLRAQTEALMSIGGCGVPSFQVERELFWGQDRLFQALSSFTGQPCTQDISLDGYTPSEQPKRVRFFHDFSSPFSYLASTQIETICQRHGVVLEWVPILLGALFKEIGTPNVPLFTFSDAKRAYLGRDLERWATLWAVPFGFPNTFPIRSVLPLRIALQQPSLTSAIYGWAWSDGVDVGDESVLLVHLKKHVQNAQELVEGARSESVKGRLRENTKMARDLGVCGVPTFVVDFEQESHLIWGQDRLCMLEWMLDGWRPSTERKE